MRQESEESPTLLGRTVLNPSCARVSMVVGGISRASHSARGQRRDGSRVRETELKEVRPCFEAYQSPSRCSPPAATSFQ